MGANLSLDKLKTTKTAPLPGLCQHQHPHGWVWDLALLYPLLLNSRLKPQWFLVILMIYAALCPPGVATEPGFPLDTAWRKNARDG